MSQRLINLSPDLRRLRDEGYEVRMVSNHLVLGHVPYVNSKKEVAFGTLVSEVTMAGNVATTPSTHVVSFAGDYPCDQNGAPLDKIRHQSGSRLLASDLIVEHSFSSKPQGGYKDYYQKMTTYAAILSTPAQLIAPESTAQTFSVIESDEHESVFHYEDTASSRAEITIVTKKLEIARVAIVGVGGTGSYVLDLVAKTPVKEIHLFDGDKFLQHNAFRSPGAPSLEDLKRQPQKAIYLKNLYSKMHRHIHAHDSKIDDSNIVKLRGMSFVFLCLDGGKAKRLLVDKLEEFQIPFMGVIKSGAEKMRKE